MVTRLLIVLSLFVQAAAFANVTATVNRTELYDDETLLLTVRVSPSDDISEQDIEALRSLFHVDQNFRSDSRQNINGRLTSTREYQFRLRPKKVGALGIPNFRVGTAQSQPILINVLDSRLRKDSLDDDAVIFTAELNTDEPYIGQTVILTMELAYKIQMRNATIAEFNPTGFSATIIDEEQGTTLKNGQSYNVYRRVISLEPESAGAFVLPDLRFSAEYPNTNLGRYMKFSRIAPVAPINVKPVPSNYPTDAFWLPLYDFKLTDNLSANNALEQFEHLDWIVTQQITGQPATRLADVVETTEASLDSLIKLYRNPPEITETRRVDVSALSFSEAGEFSLPEIRVPWWNLRTDSLEWATLPSRQFNVSASVTPTVSNITPEAIANSVSPTTVETSSTPFWRMAAIAFLILWLATIGLLVYVLRSKRSLTVNEEPEPQKTPIAKKDPYLAYLSVVRPVPNAQEFIATQLNDAEVVRLREIESRVLTGSVSTDDLKDLEKLTQKLKKQRKAATTDNRFSLYPTSV